MLKLRLLLLSFLCAHLIWAQNSNQQNQEYFVEVDILNIKNDKVFVKVFPPKITADTLIYNFPKIIPGTYAISDFGRFIDSLQAFSANGEMMTTTRIDKNRWSVADASKVECLTYWVNDTYDDPSAHIFEPAGTNIDAGKNVVFNPYGFIGYFDNFKNVPFRVSVKKPDDFYGETSLKRISSTPEQDVFTAADYYELHDNPVLYCHPDTTSMMVGNTRIAVSVYSPGGKMTAKEVLETVEDLFPAAANYLGGSLPVDQYTILVYLQSGPSMTGAMGALEHKTSTLLVMPDIPIGILSQTVKDIIAHEFFHIVTPLAIQSEYIADYDFMNPQMSEHLWLYEGCTEYAAMHVQVKENLMPMEDFFETIKNKIRVASGYDASIPFTEVSKKALGKHEDQYTNVYQQGALIGMALDLKLRILSDGDYGIQDLMTDLSREYGPDKPFVDTLLFQEIARISGYPETEKFLIKHVAGTTPLPYEDLFEKVGVAFKDTLRETIIAGGGFTLGYNPKTKRMIVVDVKNMDDFGKQLDIKYHDEIEAWNKVKLDIKNANAEINRFKRNTKPGEKVTITVWRTNAKGKKKLRKLKARAVEKENVRYNVLEPEANPTREQLRLRKKWINQ